VATKAKPQTTEVSAASIMSRIGIADPRDLYREHYAPRQSPILHEASPGPACLAALDQIAALPGLVAALPEGA
jgi:hypothetical protein